MGKSALAKKVPVEEAVEEILESSSEQLEGEAQEEILPQSTLSLKAQIGSVLFVSTKPVTLHKLTALLQTEAEEVEAALRELQTELSEIEFGFSVVEVAGGYQLRTSPQASAVIKRMIPPKAKRLSRAAAETLAVIAYKQPVQKSEIDAIRGVDSLPTLKTLLDARLARIIGHSESVGHPALYGTTEHFLEKFGLKDLSELPTVKEIEMLAAEPGEVEEVATETDSEELPDDSLFDEALNDE